MSQIRIERSHHSQSGQLQATVAELADKLVEKYGGSYQWQGDNLLQYSHSGGVEARVGFDEQSLTVDVKTGLLMAAFSGIIRAEVESYLDKHLG